MTDPQPPGRVAGIDYGTVRIGVAITDARRTMASPVESYTRRDARQDADHFRRLATEDALTLFVVGLPVHLDGRESRKSEEARRFGQWLTEITGVPVQFYDERFTTTEAQHVLSDAQMRGRRRKQRVDMLAAQIMLSAWLESSDQGTEAPRGLDD
jgi:putative Holliday junction resolvase